MASDKEFVDFVLVTASNIIFTSYCSAQTLQRVLIYTGGHDFEREAFLNILNDGKALVFLHHSLVPYQE